MATLTTLKVIVHLPTGKTLTFKPEEVVQISLHPYPALAVRTSGGSEGDVRRFLGFPIEMIDQESSLVGLA